MPRQSLFAASALAAGLVLAAAPAHASATLWFGNDGAGTDFHTTTSGAVLGTISESLTGAAWDGSTLYVGDPGATIEKKTLAGAALPGTFTIPALGSPAEDMAWDSKRHELVRVFHIGSGNQGYIERFDASGNVISSAALPTVDPTGTLTGTMGALGVAYDSLRDELDISFCNEGCGAIGGVIEAFHPTSYAMLGTVFTSATQYLGGLGYQHSTDTLWVGGADAGGAFVEHAMRDGTVLSRFASSVFPDGMEYAATPEPATWASMLLGFGVLGLAARRRRTAARAA
jgi:hypothetical protein